MAIHARRTWVIGETITVDDVCWCVWKVSDDEDPLVTLADSVLPPGPGVCLDVVASDLERALAGGYTTVTAMIRSSAHGALLDAREADQEAQDTLDAAEAALAKLEAQFQTEVHHRRAVRRCATLLDAWSIVLPPRIGNEEIGDCLEAIQSRLERGQHGKAYLTLVSCVFWTGVHAAHHLLGRQGSKTRAR